MATNSQVGIVGSGIMGSGIALVAAQSGLHVSLFDIRQDALEKAKSHIVSTVAKMNEKTKITQEQATAILNNIQYVSVLNGFSSCELVVEAVIENLETKQSVFAELEKHVSDTCILTSNTSSVSITSISSKLKHPGRFAGLHFFNPANIMPLVEIIPSSATNPEVVEFLKSKMKDWNKVPVVAKDSPGFIVNRLARPFYSESIRILEEGIADIATIDWALKEVGGF